MDFLIWRLIMKVGDLVWHIHDAQDGIYTPGIVTALHVDDTDDHPEEASVLFTDRDHEETHPQYELRSNLPVDDDENIMGNP